ncbi:MAG: O-antigen ligase family protein [Chloroflexota bacterium]
MIIALKRVNRIVEPILIFILIGAFWYASPTRDHWLWLLVLIPVSWGTRWLLYRRVWTRTPWDVFLVLFVILSIINMYAAPYRRAPDIPYSFFVLMARPLLGIAIFSYFVEQAREQKTMVALLIGTLVLGGVVAVLGLGASQWTSKSLVLRFMTDALPRVADLLGPFDAKGGFNVNEIAGALAWLCPLVAGIIGYRWKGYNRFWRGLTAMVFALLFLALFLGQSRFALAGAMFTLAVLAGLLIPSRRGRWAAWGVLVAVAVLEILIVRDVFAPPGQQVLAERDEASMSIRFDIWGSALHIIRDYPLTGVGLNMFRDGRVRALYPVPTFPTPVLPHAHNEWLQVGTDMGIPGLIVYIGLQLVTVYALVKGYRQGDSSAKAIFAAVGAGLFAHAFFGLGDAIPLWDRFGFVLWWLVALGGAQYVLTMRKIQL